SGWRAWEECSGRRLLGSEGCLFVGADAADAAALEHHSVPHRFVDDAGQRGSLPLLQPVDGAVLLDECGGALRARRAIEVLLDLIGDRLVHAEVLGISAPKRGGIQLQVADCLYRARRVVLCAGAAT